MKQSESELITELEQQIFSYVEICAMNESTPSALGFAQHLKESYE